MTELWLVEIETVSGKLKSTGYLNPDFETLLSFAVNAAVQNLLNSDRRKVGSQHYRDFRISAFS